ncbi:rod shape-determining protein MreD [Sutterella sp.]|uniref:rod shape-determining protein MreD n=1 Tax=Sutterella sp. TaxID=1981025 RepID=UPI0026E0B04D|nr:rod shape-determining protein MreD [Sutterella sp.]MDO5530413.1 rod shape-determining protein MreD [Sutterella sp.]
MMKPDYSGLRAADDSVRLERPASASWVVFTFLMAIVFTIAGSPWLWMPNFLSLTIIYWTLRQPESAGMTVAFICGILMDVINGSVLGQQALAFVTLCYFTTSLARRLAWFNLIGQSLHILPLLLFSQILVMLVRLWFDGLWPGWEWFLSSVTGALIWPVWAKILRPRPEPVKTL